MQQHKCEVVYENDKSSFTDVECALIHFKSLQLQYDELTEDEKIGIDELEEQFQLFLTI